MHNALRELVLIDFEPACFMTYTCICSVINKIIWNSITVQETYALLREIQLYIVMLMNFLYGSVHIFSIFITIQLIIYLAMFSQNLNLLQNFEIWFDLCQVSHRWSRQEQF